MGNYRLDASVNRDEMSTDEALTMRVTVVGEGDIKRISPFDPVDRKNWDVYDPKVLQEEQLDSPSGMVGRKIIEYKLVPKRGGKYTLNPGLVYFNVDSLDYVTLAPEFFNVTVAGGTGQASYDFDTTGVAEPELTLLRVDDAPPGRVYGRDPATSLGYWLLFLLPILGSISAIGWQRYRAHLDDRDPAELARAGAAAAAKARLAEADTHLRNVAARPFYDAVEGALLNYLRDKLGLPVAELSRKNIATQLTAAGADSLTGRYDRLLQRCEMALYAGQDSAEDLAQTYEEAKNLIIDTEKTLAKA